MMMGLNQLADLTGRAPKTIRKALDGLPPKPGPNRSLLWDTKQALPLIYGLRPEGGDRLDPQQEKAQLDRERRLIAELERKQREGALLDKNDVAEEWAAVSEIAKSRWLAYPSRMAPEVAGLTSHRQIEDRLRDGVYEILREFIGDVRSRRVA